jgi:hypothetical protein
MSTSIQYVGRRNRGLACREVLYLSSTKKTTLSAIRRIDSAIMISTRHGLLSVLSQSDHARGVSSYLFQIIREIS